MHSTRGPPPLPIRPLRLRTSPRSGAAKGNAQGPYHAPPEEGPFFGVLTMNEKFLYLSMGGETMEGHLDRPVGAGAISRETDSTRRLLDLWLHGRLPHTQRAYRADVERFLAFCGKPLRQVHAGGLTGVDGSPGGPGPHDGHPCPAVQRGEVAPGMGAPGRSVAGQRRRRPPAPGRAPASGGTDLAGGNGAAHV